MNCLKHTPHATHSRSAKSSGRHSPVNLYMLFFSKLNRFDRPRKIECTNVPTIFDSKHIKMFVCFRKMYYLYYYGYLACSMVACVHVSYVYTIGHAYMWGVACCAGFVLRWVYTDKRRRTQLTIVVALYILCLFIEETINLAKNDYATQPDQIPKFNQTSKGFLLLRPFQTTCNSMFQPNERYTQHKLLLI